MAERHTLAYRGASHLESGSQMSEEPRWVSPLPGTWIRNFRLGEWLPEPVTPLFETWLLDELEQASFPRMTQAGIATHVVIDGWYFHSPGAMRQLVRLGLRDPLGMLLTFGVTRWRPDLTERWSVSRATSEWLNEVAPAYEHAVEHGFTRLSGASPSDVVAIVDDVAKAAGRYFGSITRVAGFGWKAELTLVRFYERHLKRRVGGQAQDLLVALSDESVSAEDHAVFSLDWVHPTFGENHRARTTHEASNERARQRRLELEASCANALRPATRRRFLRLLAVAQASAVRREVQVRELTLGWPLLRASALQLGETAVASGAVEIPEDVFFLTRHELDRIVGGAARVDYHTAVRERREHWARQRELKPPLRVGAPSLLDRLAPRPAPTDSTSDVIARGTPSSPGRVTGPARIVRSPADFDRVHDGDVIVAALTTPAWTPLLAMAAAVITEGGNTFAHAAITAREFAIPAIVATHRALDLIPDGLIVTVDGSRGVVTRDGTSSTHR